MVAENLEFNKPKNAQDTNSCGYVEAGQETLPRINLQTYKLFALTEHIR